MDKARIEAAVREILFAIGEDPDREGLRETPRRVASMYGEIFAGMEEDPRQHLKIFTEDQNDEMVTVRDIPLYSMCCLLYTSFSLNPRLKTQPLTNSMPVTAAEHRAHLLSRCLNFSEFWILPMI